MKQVVLAAAPLALGATVCGCSGQSTLTGAPSSSRLSSTTVASTLPPNGSTTVATATPPGGPVLLSGDGIAGVRFGDSEASAIADLDKVLGSPSGEPTSEAGNCNIDAAEQWATATAYFDTNKFVGYSTSAANGEALPMGNMATAMGLRVGDTINKSQEIYGSAFKTSLTQGGSWSVATAVGTLDGYLSGEPNQTGPPPTIASIEAGSVGCPAASP